MVTAGGLSEAEFNGATLSLQSQTTLSLYFTDTDKLTFSCVDENNDVRTVETKKNGSTQIARIRNIAASELQNSFTVTVKKGESIIYNHLSAAVVNELLGNGGIYYWQKEKAIQLVSARGVQFPKGDIKDGFVKSISDSKSKVKKKYHDVKNTRQFRYWFGDWQNKPQNASKVVDKDGKPLVVYHQTDADYTVFDTESKGAGRYDDETPAGIFLKPTNADIGLQGQKQMALYANIRNPLSVNSRDDLVRYYSKNIDGYTEAKQRIKDIDEAYGQKFKEEEKRENVEYQT